MPVHIGGIAGMAYNELKDCLGMAGGHTQITSTIMQLARAEPQVLERFDACITGAGSRVAGTWRAGTLPDGSPCELPESFQPETLEDGSQVMRDEAGRITGRLPKDGFYFDAVYYPLEHVDTVEALAQLDDSVLGGSIWTSASVMSRAALDDLRASAKELYETTDYALLAGSGGIYETAQFLRGWGNWLMDLAANQRFAEALLDRLVELRIEQLTRTLPAVEGYVQIVGTGDDLGLQNGPQLNPELYRKIVKPRHKRLYEAIKAHTSAYLSLHTCGSVVDFIPDFIELGVDIINPVQVGAQGMDSRELKAAFGDDITFMGGGCDPQHVLAFGTPQEVRDEVKRRIDDLAPAAATSSATSTRSRPRRRRRTSWRCSTPQRNSGCIEQKTTS